MLDSLKPYAKTVVATLGLIAQAVNLWVPAYGAETTSIVATVVAVLTALGVYAKSND